MLQMAPFLCYFKTNIKVVFNYFITMSDIRFQLWPHIKLMIILWLIIPDFGRTSYVYNYLIRSMKPQIVTWRLNSYWRDCFAEKDNFLLHAERYMKENGTETLQKLIASKVITAKNVKIL
jgi:hypothetical protein